MSSWAHNLKLPKTPKILLLRFLGILLYMESTKDQRADKKLEPVNGLSFALSKVNNSC